MTKIMACKPDPILLLADAIRQNTEQSKELLAWLKSHAGGVTLEDLKQTEQRILAAIGDRVDPETFKLLAEQLKGPTDALKAAVQTAKTKP